MRFETQSLVLGASGAGEDRVAIATDPDNRTWIVVADGAGGTGGGAAAAECVIASAARHAAEKTSSLVTVLSAIDHEVRSTGGEAACAIVVLDAEEVIGASVGDCEAWIIGASGQEILTRDQVRKPLLGSGAAKPRAFEPASLDGTLVVATDGLFKYVRAETLCTLARNETMQSMTTALVDAVRLPSGERWDDLGIVVARRALLQP